MHKCLITFILCYVILVLSISVSALDVNDQGLVARWRFEEGSGTVAYDNTSHAHTGTISAASYVSSKGGNGTGDFALHFNSTDYSYVAIDYDGEAFNLLNYTLVAWIQTNSSAPQRIVNWQAGDSYIILAQNELMEGAGILDSRDGFYGDSSTAMQDGFWHHFGMTRSDGDAYRWYEDGEEVYDVPASVAYYFGGIAAVQIGRHDEGDRHYDGDIDEVMVWNRSLSVEEMKSLFDYGLIEGLNDSVPIPPFVWNYTSPQNQTLVVGQCADTLQHHFLTISLIVIAIIFLVIGLGFGVPVFGIFGAFMLFASSWYLFLCAYLFALILFLFSLLAIVYFAINFMEASGH